MNLWSRARRGGQTNTAANAHVSPATTATATSSVRSRNRGRRMGGPSTLGAAGWGGLRRPGPAAARGRACLSLLLDAGNQPEERANEADRQEALNDDR